MPEAARVFGVTAVTVRPSGMQGIETMAKAYKAFGAKEASRLSAVRDKAVTDISWVIARADPELSYWPETPLASR